VKREKKRLFRRAEVDRYPRASDAAGGDQVEPTAGAPAGSKSRSVESMLQEFTSGDTPATRRTPRAGKYDQLWQLSMSDPHTGLANQLLLLDRLTQALARMRRHGGEVVVCHVNLDNLGEINTDFGYTVGNTVLCEMADRLTSVLRMEDTVGRIGGNELVVVLAVSDEHSVGPLSRRLQKTLDKPVVVAGQPIRLHATLGVALAEDDESAEDLLARADRSTRAGAR
jgi:diguanylate cyclase (GGDEF)-like protein